MKRLITTLIFAIATLLFGTAKAEGKINIELRQSANQSATDPNVSVGLYLVSDSTVPQLSIAADIVFGWDNTKLQLLGLDSTGAASVLQSSFPNVDLNETNPPQDGNGFYMMLGNFGSPLPVQPSGTLITTFKFKPLSTSGMSNFSILPSGGTPNRYTRVLDGTVPNLNVTGTIGSPAQIVLGPEPTSTLRRIEVLPAVKMVQESGTILAGTEYQGPVAISAPKTTLFDCFFPQSKNGTLEISGNARGALITNCEFDAGNNPSNNAKSIVCYTGETFNSDGQLVSLTDGCAATFRQCKFNKCMIPVKGGIYQFIDCEFTIGALFNIDAIDAKINFMGCRFKSSGSNCAMRVSGFANGVQTTSTTKSRFYFANCTLDDVAVDGRSLCRRFPSSTDVKAGRKDYGLPNSVPTSCFLKAPAY